MNLLRSLSMRLKECYHDFCIYTEPVTHKDDKYIAISLIDQKGKKTNSSTFEYAYLVNVRYGDKDMRNDEVAEIAEQLAFVLRDFAQEFSQVYIDGKLNTTFVVTSLKTWTEQNPLVSHLEIDTELK